MKTLWIFLFLLACFGVVGRIDYESAVAMQSWRVAGWAR